MNAESSTLVKPARSLLLEYPCDREQHVACPDTLADRVDALAEQVLGGCDPSTTTFA